MAKKHEGFGSITLGLTEEEAVPFVLNELDKRTGITKLEINGIELSDSAICYLVKHFCNAIPANRFGLETIFKLLS